MATRLIGDRFVYLDIETTMGADKLHMVSWQACERNEHGAWEPVKVPEWSSTVDGLPDGPYMAHNGINFDYPVLDRLVQWSPDKSELYDSLLLAQMAVPDNLGGHSAKALMPLVGEQKIDYTGDFSVLDDHMIEYGLQDTRGMAKVACKLLNDMEALGFSQESLDLEHAVAWEVNLVHANGFRLDTKKAMLLKGALDDEMVAIKERILASFYPNVEPLQGKPRLMEGVVSREEAKQALLPFGKPVPQELKSGLYRITPVNLNSRQQLAERLIHAGWKPTKFTVKSIEKYRMTGVYSDLTPIIDETTLEDSTVPEAKDLLAWFKAGKLLAYVAKWLELQQEDGRVHGRMFSIGAPTARMAHFDPNMAQIPKVSKSNPMGYKCRECWTVDEGMVLVGCDASGIELRCLAHYARDDEMTAQILDGDIHTENQKAVQLETRDQAKTFIYAWLYGAGPAKLGAIAGLDSDWGAKAKNRLLKRWRGVERLVKKVADLASSGWIPGLDGRKLFVRKPHAALNTLLQSAGAIVMKKALLIMRDTLTEEDIPFKVVAIVHDEFQIECAEKHAEAVMAHAQASIVAAGVMLNMRVPLAAEAKVGKNWAETH